MKTKEMASGCEKATMNLFGREYIEEKIKTKEYGPAEIGILKALHKYLFLDSTSLAGAVNLVIDARLRKPHYKRNLKNMLGKTVKKFMYEKQQSGRSKTAVIAVYYLSYPVYAYMKELYASVSIPYRMRGQTVSDILAVYDAEYIMERLMLNRWHINFMACHTDIIRAEKYCQKARIAGRKMNVHSLFKIRTYGRKNIFIAAVPCGKRLQGKKHAYECIAGKIREFGNTKEGVLVVLICSSYMQMEEVYRGLSETDKNAAERALYVLEADVVEGVGTERLYRLTSDGKYVIRTYCRIPVLTGELTCIGQLPVKIRI